MRVPDHARGRAMVLGTPDIDVSQLHQSLVDVAELAPDVPLAGHGSLVLEGAVDHVAFALDAFRRGSLPPSWLS